ncbi:hypothetical protein KQX54_001997, partial [Cotesia glomerata]
MVNKCIVDGCLSDRIKDRSEKLKLNSRNTSLFIVPQCPDLLKLWNRGLKQDFTPKKDYVCELHFNDKYIIKTDKILLTTGIYEELPRKRHSLKLGAIPTLNPNRVNKACNNENNEAQYMQCHLLLTNDHKTNSPQNQEPIISNDLINIINCESPECIDEFENFEENDNCENEMQEFLKELEDCELCEGTGFNEERYSLACSGVSLPDEQYKKQMNLFRCFACRQLRRKLQNRSYKVKPDIKTKQVQLLKRK